MAIFALRRENTVSPRASGKTLRRIILSFAAVQCLLLLVPRESGAAVIYSALSQRELSVGDRVYFTVTTIIPKGATVVPPDPASSFGPVTVKEWNSKRYDKGKADSLAFQYVLTTYKAENCTIPSLLYILENGTEHDTLKTDSLTLRVIPLCKTDSAGIMDLRPQQHAGKQPLLWLWLLLGAVLLTIGIIAGRHVVRKLRKAPPPPPPKPPYEEAIDALAALDAKQFPIKGMVREYVFELSDILKRYVERSFPVNAAEFTTEEMLAWIAISPLERQLRATLEWFFRTADPVKFAKYLPDHDTLQRFGTEVRAFLEATRPPLEQDKKAPDVATAAAAPSAPKTSAQKTTGGAA